MDHAISLDKYRRCLCKWKEATSTSPLGRHLGVYRALLDLSQVTADMCSMLNVVTRTGIIPSCWCAAISVLLEKHTSAPNVNRLRIIHLFEADYNLFLKVMWAKRLVLKGEALNAFGESQQGTQPRQKVQDAVLLKTFTYELNQILHTNLGTFDNDAKSCYDRIIKGLAMLVARWLGCSCNQCWGVEGHEVYCEDLFWVVKQFHSKFTRSVLVRDGTRKPSISGCMALSEYSVVSISEGTL